MKAQGRDEVAVSCKDSAGHGAGRRHVLGAAREGPDNYTGADCAGWMRQAGFGATRVEALVRFDSMVVGIK